MKKRIVWRLKEQPSAEMLRELVKDGILSKDEAREILFNSETVEERDTKSLEEEIKFLRKLVEELSRSNRTTIIETIKEVEKPWRKWDFYKPYETWCYNNTLKLNADTTATYTANSAVMGTSKVNADFAGIKTF